MDRLSKALCHIDKNGYGIEIGPSHNPIAPKRDGYRVDIIDHLNRDQLIEKYTEHNVCLENIEHVDYVWNGESYAELTGNQKFYDWVIASHVIEHTTDLIGFLNDCDNVLKDDGVISLIVPDQRYCFDHFRPTTGLAKIIDAHYLKNSIHSPGTAAEYFLNVVSKNGQIAWAEKFEGEYSLVHSLKDARTAIDSILNQKVYLDLHAWCFTPYSFRLIIDDLFHLGFISLREVSFFTTTGCEFYITLGRKGEGPNLDRLELLKVIESELTQALETKPEVVLPQAKSTGGFLLNKLTKLREAFSKSNGG
jgi:2-polyprenyl-3-methyl-5-hydroxy-6-metoxy-1,4-benzoquinol methylase